jgi:hypothetical protein
MISDYGKEIFLFTLDAVAFAYTLKWYNQTCKAQQALSVSITVLCILCIHM